MNKIINGMVSAVGNIGNYKVKQNEQKEERNRHLPATAPMMIQG